MTTKTSATRWPSRARTALAFSRLLPLFNTSSTSTIGWSVTRPSMGWPIPVGLRSLRMTKPLTSWPRSRASRRSPTTRGIAATSMPPTWNGGRPSNRSQNSLQMSRRDCGRNSTRRMSISHACSLPLGEISRPFRCTPISAMTRRMSCRRPGSGLNMATPPSGRLELLRPVIRGVTPELFGQCGIAIGEDVEDDVDAPLIAVIAGRVPQIVVEPPEFADVPGAADAGALHPAAGALQDQVVAVAAEIVVAGIPGTADLLLRGQPPDHGARQRALAVMLGELIEKVHQLRIVRRDLARRRFLHVHHDVDVVGAGNRRVHGAAQQDGIGVLLHADLAALGIEKPVFRLGLDLLQDRCDIDVLHHLAEMAHRPVEAGMVRAHGLRRELRPPKAPEVVLVVAQPPENLRHGAVEHVREFGEVHRCAPGNVRPRFPAERMRRLRKPGTTDRIEINHTLSYEVCTMVARL